MASEVLLNAREQIKKACDILGYSDEIYEILKEPERMIQVSIPVKMDNGKTKVFKGYRSQHSSVLGPYKGGIRFHPQVTMDEVIALSIWMTFKAGIVGVPYGGGKGGVIVDPNDLSKNELEQLSRGYISKMHKYLGVDIDIPAPDIGTDGQIMSWMLDQYETIKGRQEPGMITGKPVEIGGSLGRKAATGYGVVEVAKEYLKKIDKKPEETTAILQGFGNVGSYTGKYLHESGIKTVAVAGHNNGQEYAIYNKDGINISELIEFRKHTKDMTKFENVKVISIEDFWKLEVDLLIPAALENVINRENAEDIRAIAVLEAANGPITSEGDKILKERGIFVSPDVLTNAGGVLVSYFEWVQNRQGYYWSEDEVKEKQSTMMKEAFRNVWDLKEELKDVTMREAAYAYSMKRVVKSMEFKKL